MGIGNMPFFYGLALAMLVIAVSAFEPAVAELLPVVFISGLIAGFVFALARDHLVSIAKIFR